MEAHVPLYFPSRVDIDVFIVVVVCCLLFVVVGAEFIIKYSGTRVIRTPKGHTEVSVLSSVRIECVNMDTKGTCRSVRIIPCPY